MSTELLNELDDPALIEADQQVVMNHVFYGQPIDPVVEARVRERSRRSTEEIRRRFGVVDVAVSTLREIRDEE